MRPKARRGALCLCCGAVSTALFLSGCQRGSEPVEPEVESQPVGSIAKVGKQYLFESDLEFYLKQGFDRERALEQLIEHELLSQRATREEFDQDPEMRGVLRRILAQRFERSYLDQLQGPSLKELQANWESDSRWIRPARVQVAAIRRSFHNDLSKDAALQALRDAREVLIGQEEEATGGGFGALAVQYSDEPNTRFQGGQMGWLEKGEAHLLIPSGIYPKIFEQTAIGLIPELLVADDSVWLVRVLDMEDQTRVPFEKARDLIKQSIRQERATEARGRLRDQASEETQVVRF